MKEDAVCHMGRGRRLRVEERSMKKNREREMMMSEVDIEGEEWELSTGGAEVNMTILA